MLRIDLNVPDDEHEKARKLGAHWDVTAKIWFIYNDVDPAPFIKWLPFYNVHAPFWYLAQTRTPCRHCHEQTTVTAFMLPAGHKILEEDEEDGEIDYTEQENPAFVFYIVDIPTQVRNALSSFNHALRKEVSQQIRRQHWINHCEKCGAQQNDAEMFCEMGGAFFPASSEEAASILLHRIDEPFIGYCEDASHHYLHIDPKNKALDAFQGACYASDWFELMTQVVNTPSRYLH
ncbi:DUF5710 domain-containing protein [Xenorhabdus sp. XENO-7]|uniref:DUF5710 domain-containing protein n=1 Tax=Xenorhabdus aichiensis TaxID=3025874 RepID=A0ABT5M7R4_9GAMM|nr:DUF5710 domain-containing protein [Xenorhabdus aichiensis]MDC9623085.1 DUF5710 domain-containing protein [Xenorhabdus aichiensis]